MRRGLIFWGKGDNDMKKTLVVIIVLMALGTLSYASPVSQQWIKTYGTSNDDVIHLVRQTTDG